MSTENKSFSRKLKEFLGKKNLRQTIWLYFVVYIMAVVLVIWFFQVVMLPRIYQASKTRDIQRVATSIWNGVTDENFSDELKKIAYDNNMCICILDKYGSIVESVDVMAGTCDIHGINGMQNIPQYRMAILSSENGIIYQKNINSRINSTTLVFGMLIGTKDEPIGYILLNTSMEPIDSTVTILEEMLFYISLTLLSLGIIVSYFMARVISTPIAKITKSAEGMAAGDYNTHFDGAGYSEAEKLATTLNYASSEISKVDTLRRDLIANISHDLRTPLTMVKAYAEMIRDLSGDNPEKRRKHVDVIIEESDRLTALVADILDLSKAESGNTELSITSFPISEKLREILRRYDLFSEQKQFEFKLELKDEVMVSADMLKIEQVIYNLINNAINYSGESKVIEICQINLEKSVRIEIRDHGDGIDSELLPLIFDRYYRAEKTRRDVIGTGLGLSIVKAVLRQHNFPFGVQSVKGEGSTFWFEIFRTPPKTPEKNKTQN